MSYPQPSSNQACLNGATFFRLNTPLTSPGDIYESEQGSHAIALGPQSDIASVVVNYFDDAAKPTYVNQVAVSPARGFVGLIASRVDSAYAPMQRPGRILFWASDLYDPNYRPTGFNPTDDAIQFITPQLDVIQYFSPQPSLTPGRVDRSYVFQVYPNAAGSSYIVIPFYGRRYCFVNFSNRNQTDPASLRILGVNYAITDNAGPHPAHQETELLATTAVASNDTILEIFDAGANGVFDAIVFQITGDPAPLRVVTSDVPISSPGGGT